MRKWYNSTKAAELLSVHSETIRRYVREGKLDCGRVGNQLRFSEDMLDEFVESGGSTGPREPSNADG